MLVEAFFVLLALSFLHFNGASAKNVLHFAKNDNLPPVVFISGDGGSMIEVQINKTGASDTDCPKHRDWYREWLNLEELLPENFPCQVEVLKLLFDSKTNTSYSPEGVKTRSPGFGTAHSIEYIDDSWAAKVTGVGDYAHALVEELTSYGLVRDHSIRGAPYDFRLSMASHHSYFKKLQTLVESTYNANGNSKVVLISHSLGGIYTTWFLNHQSQAWKDQYVDSFISLSTPWGGSTESLQALTSGFTFHHSLILNPLVARQEQRTWESNFLLLPNNKVIPKEVILTDERNYTAKQQDILELFKRINITADMYRYVRDANDPKTTTGVMPPHPGVDVFCLYGTNVATNNVLDYRGKNFPDAKPTMITYPGDGTVAHGSLAACKEWNLGERIVEIPSATHNGLMKNKDGINAVVKILQSRRKSGISSFVNNVKL